MISFSGLAKLMADGKLGESPLAAEVAAVSVGMVGGRALLDLCYEEDAAAEVDMNIAMTGKDEFIELQGTGEQANFTEAQLAAMLDLGTAGIRQLIGLQQAALAG